MPDFYSSALSSSPGALPLQPYVPPTGEVGAVVRYTRARFRFNTSHANLDVMRLMQFNSADRLLSLYLTVEDISDLAFNIDIGWWLAGLRHSGAAIDPGLIASNYNPSTAMSADQERQDILHTSASGVGFDEIERGEMIWEQLDYSADPQLDFNLAARIEGTPGSPCNTLWEAYYLSNT